MRDSLTQFEEDDVRRVYDEATAIATGQVVTIWNARGAPLRAALWFPVVQPGNLFGMAALGYTFLCNNARYSSSTISLLRLPKLQWLLIFSNLYTSWKSLPFLNS